MCNNKNQVKSQRQYYLIYQTIAKAIKQQQQDKGQETNKEKGLGKK